MHADGAAQPLGGFARIRENKTLIKALLPLLLTLAALLLLGNGGEAGMTKEEQRLADTLSSVQGAGRVRVTLYYAESVAGFGSAKTPVGALAVASGAGDIRVRLELTEALETLLGLAPGQALVLKMEGT